MNGQQQQSDVICNCGQPKKLGTCQSNDKGNYGREFLSCPQPREQQCKNAFMWTDGNNSNAQGNNLNFRAPRPAAAFNRPQVQTPQPVYMSDLQQKLDSLIEKTDHILSILCASNTI